VRHVRKSPDVHRARVAIRDRFAITVEPVLEAQRPPIITARTRADDPHARQLHPLLPRLHQPTRNFVDRPVATHRHHDLLAPRSPLPARCPPHAAAASVNVTSTGPRCFSIGPRIFSKTTPVFPRPDRGLTIRSGFIHLNPCHDMTRHDKSICGACKFYAGGAKGFSHRSHGRFRRFVNVARRRFRFTASISSRSFHARPIASNREGPSRGSNVKTFGTS
jgi:hypothetical protein